MREYYKKRYNEDPEYNLVLRCRARLREALKNASTKKSKSTLALIGCTGYELKNYIESLFHSGMSWGNRREWHLDHIVPVSYFNLENSDELSKCFHYTNLRPLWGKDNLTKGKNLYWLGENI